MPQQLWDVSVTIGGNIVSTLRVAADNAIAAEDLAAEGIKLEAVKFYQKGQDNEQETESGAVTGH